MLKNQLGLIKIKIVKIAADIIHAHLTNIKNNL